MTFQFRSAGDPSVTPASTARTSNSCFPFLTLTLNGEAQGAKALPSTLHSNVAPGVVELNSNVAFFFLVFFFGPLSIFVSGPPAP